MRKPDSTSTPAAQSILAVVARIPRGKVTTYGSVAERAGQPRRARLVGRLLSQLPAGSRLPWHRVVAANGRIALPAGSTSHGEQVARLRREGVAVVAGRVDVRAHGWGSAPADLDRWLWHVGPPAGLATRGGNRSDPRREGTSYAERPCTGRERVNR